jgi:predicted permease
LVFILIMAATAMVLAVACANVAGLQLARSRSRQSELQTRRALGASRLRVIRQLLTESVMLGLLSGATALLFTWAFLKVAVRLVANLMPAEYGSLVFDVTPDPGIFAFVVSISLIAGILFGLVPALESSGSALVSSNRNSTSSARSRRLQDFLVATQVALSLVLLIAGGMFLHSAIHSLDTDPGYQSKHVVNIDIKFSETSKYTAARRSALVRELRRRVEELPGVTAVTSARPPADNRFQTVAVSLDGQLSVLNYRYVQPDYFQTLHIPMILGTAFQSEARQEEEFVILSESAAKLLWPGQNPVGRSLRLGPVDERFHRLADLHADGPAYRVIGVAGDTRGAELGGSDSRQVYLLLPTDRIQDYSILMRTETDPTEIIRATDSMMASFDSGMFATSATLAEMLRASPLFVASSLSAAFASTVGVFGLLLAAMGIHGTVSFIVVLRTREVGIRMSLGAQKHDVLGLILRETTRPVFVGLIAGMLLATVVSYSLRTLLYGIDIVDSVSFIAVSLLFLVIASLAAYQPVRRAMRVDPTVALRYE